MSGAVKQRAAVPSASHPSTLAHTESNNSKGTSNGSATLSYPAEVCDDVNMNEVDGLVALDVTLPTGQHMDITVDYNTPMRDLLVCLAGKSKLSPSGLVLQLLSEDDGSTLTYRPNQVIGALGGRQVRLVNKKEKTNKSKNKAGQKPFEMTNRFTVNLPRGQKTVVRVSPVMTLGQLMTSVCQDKDLDPRRHFLQLPGKPGIPIDSNITVGQLGIFEISLISHSSVQERSIANSMPDLSQVPTYMPNAGESKKKRGFLSFLKKDRKFKPQDALYETSSTASNRMSATQPPPPSQRRVSDAGYEPSSSRPKSMFVTASNSNPPEFSLPQKENKNTQSQENIAPTRKKRRAPAPPTPTTTEQISLSKQDINANENNIEIHNGEISSSHPTANSSNQSDASSSINKSNSAPSRAEMLSRLHSRNSSDSSGYHELTLSGCESPEAGHTLASKSKTSIDSTSIESSDINNGGDSGIHESPVRVSPIEEVLEKSDVVSHVLPSSDDNNDSNNYAIKSTTLPLPSKKKKKAPAPPAPSVQPSTQHIQSTTLAVVESAPADFPDVHDAAKNQSVQESQESIQVSVSSEVALSNHESHSEVISPPDSIDGANPTQAATDPSTSMSLHMNEDPDISDEDINTAFDIDDILNGVTFDDEPNPLEIKTFSMLNKGKDTSAMMMMETSSIASENIEQVDTVSKSDRPCSFIPPPPPTEPPPPEVEAVNMADLGTTTTTHTPVLIDKGTEVNDDNTSLAPASIKNSPELDRHNSPHHVRMGSFSSLGSVDTIEGLSLDFQVAIKLGEESLHPCVDDVEVSQDSYKNEMALFVERMSKMAVENNEDNDANALNDSISLSISETNSETGSVIQHLRTDSSDSKSGLDSGSWSRKDARKINDIEESDENENASQLKVSEELSVPVETVPPPPEFGDGQENQTEDNVDSEEEEYTETIEEIIIPLGPNGFDFTAARKVPDKETQKEQVYCSSIENEDTSGVFRAEPVSIKPISTKIDDDNKRDNKKSEVHEKEEFILTTDDLSSVSFLPQRRKVSQSSSNPAPKRPESTTSSATLLMDQQKTNSKDEESSTESIQNRVSQLSFTPRSEPENDSVLEVKSISLLNRPTMRASTIQDKPPIEDEGYASTSIYSTTSLSNVSASPEIPKDESHTSNGISNNIPNQDELVQETYSSNSSFNNSHNKDVSEENFDRPGSRASANGQDAQYDMLQMQFAQWQEQLATNQSILSQATANDLQSEQLQQLTTQMTMQQNMMLQIQATMQTLQQQQLLNGDGNGDKAASVEFPSVDVEQAAAAAEPPPPPPPPPVAAPPVPAASGTGTTTKETENSTKSGQTKTKSRPKPKFERELDPREQLMIAIRTFQGREGLNSVPKKDTTWVHSNR